MSYGTAYWLECEDPQAYTPDCCPPTEMGRARSVGFVKRSYLQTLLAGVSSSAVWETGVAAGKIAILPFTSGSFDSGKQIKLKGYGRRLSTHPYRDMNLSFSIPFNQNNYDFFNTLDKRTDLVPFFRTSSIVHICDQAADISTQELVEDDLESLIGWNVECIIRSRNIPIKTSLTPLRSLFMCDFVAAPGGIGFMIIGSTFIVG
jgi:hypothetical protein